jgi:eukaryotic-like serine/threonine-protein kinase
VADSDAGPLLDHLAPLRAALADRYALEEEIGRGGMALVYRARDHRHDRPVAIKILRPGLLAAGESAARFLREIRFAAQLTHPRILPVHDSGQIPDPAGPPTLFYVMPYVADGSLRDRLKASGRLPVEDALEFVRAAGSALDFAHRQNVVHRDIKPENILIQGGEAVVADFGVARAVCEECDRQSITAPGFAIGTPAYMSPEQASGDPVVDARSDQYALACVLYELLAGEPPFSGTGARATMARHATEPPPALRAHRGEVPLAVERAVLRALAKEPADRFESVAAFCEALADPHAGEGDRPHSPERTIAVLPFTNASPDPDNEYISDGITDELIHALAHVEGLRVASRSSVFALKGRREDVRAIGAMLRVSVVLEGSVRRAGDRVRITAQLSDAENGRLLWSERFEREGGDILQLQDDLAATIVATLRTTLLTPGPLGEFAPRRRTANSRAYHLYLRGRHAWNKRNGADMVRAVEFFEQAIAEDPGFALAYTGLADAYAQYVDYRAMPVAEGLGRAKAEAKRAIALDDTLAEAHTSLAWVHFIYEWDWTAAEREFRRALELDPSYASTHQWYSWYLAAMGRMGPSLAEGERSVELDPTSVSIRRSCGWLHYYARTPQLGLPHLQRALVMNPESHDTQMLLGVMLTQAGRLTEAREALAAALDVAPEDSYGLLSMAHVDLLQGRRQEAEAAWDRLEALAKVRYVSPTDFARLALVLGRTEAAFDWIERIYAERRGWIVYMKVDPLFDALRSDQRFLNLLQRMNLQ